MASRILDASMFPATRTRASASSRSKSVSSRRKTRGLTREGIGANRPWQERKLTPLTPHGVLDGPRLCFRGGRTVGPHHFIKRDQAAGHGLRSPGLGGRAQLISARIIAIQAQGL